MIYHDFTIVFKLLPHGQFRYVAISEKLKNQSSKKLLDFLSLGTYAKYKNGHNFDKVVITS